MRVPPPSPSRRVRRRRRVLGLLALIALLAGLATGAFGGRDDAPSRTARADRASASPAAQADDAVARMSLDRQIGQLLLISFRGSTAPPYVLRALREGRAAGVILFGANAPSAASVRALTTQLQRAAGGDAIVCLDQEGGDIRTLAFAPSAEGQARQSTPAAARDAASATAAALRAVGVNVLLGPVADVAAPTDGSVMAGRAFPGDAAAVTDSVRAAVSAYERAGIAPALKHFPGIGGATANTDDVGVVVTRTHAEVDASDLRPFQVAAEAPTSASVRGRLVMVGHARYPALDPDRIASQSHAIVTGLLREQLGFDGVAITDSLEAEASLAASGRNVGTAAVRSLAAGVDLLLLTGPGSFLPAHDALLAKARSSPAFRARLAESAARVIALRRTLRS